MWIARLDGSCLEIANAFCRGSEALPALRRLTSNREKLFMSGMAFNVLDRIPDDFQEVIMLTRTQ